jgi:hypothetical protein
MKKPGKRSIEADAPQHTAFASSPPSPMPQDEEENDDGSTSREGSSNGNGNENGNDEEESLGSHNARSKKVARLEARLAELEEENALYRCILETQEVLVVGTHYFFLRLYPFRDIIDILLGRTRENVHLLRACSEHALMVASLPLDRNWRFPWPIVDSPLICVCGVDQF